MPAIFTRGKRPFALEMIKHQTDTFGADIEAQMTTLHAKIRSKTMSVSELDSSPEIKELIRLVKKRLGLKITFITDSGLAAVLPFYSNKNHIFLDQWFRGEFSIKEQDAVLRGSKSGKGTVDTENAVVTGIFSEYEVPVLFNFNEMFTGWGITPGEATGILLHELGHAFEACEYSDRLSTTNQVLESVAKAINGKKPGAAEYVYKELQVVNPKVTAEQVDTLVNGNKVIAGVTWFKVVIGSVDAQLTNNAYDATAFEQLADGLASRFGYGRQVMTGLDKLHISSGSEEKSRSVRVFALLYEVLVTGIALFVLITTSSILIGALVAALLYFIFRVSGSAKLDMTYDELKDRYKRIRNDSVDLLKSPSLPKATVKGILDNIYTMDNIIKNTYPAPSIWKSVSDFVFTDNRNAAASIAEQKLLEELTFNDLFVKSAELKTLA